MDCAYISSITGDLGRIVNKLTEGCYFGERALMTAEVRAASIRVNTAETACLVFSRAVYEEIIRYVM